MVSERLLFTIAAPATDEEFIQKELEPKRSDH